MYNEIKLKVVNAVWANPAPAFGCGFKNSSRNYQENTAGGDYKERGKIRIGLISNGANIWVHYNGSSRQSGDLFSYLQEYHLNTANYADTLRTLAGLYNIPVEVSQQEKEQLNRVYLARDVAPFLIKALQNNTGGVTAQYVTQVRRLSLDGHHLGELSAASIREALAALKARGKSWTPEDLRALGLTEERAAAGYTLVIPYYHNGIIQGFIYRNIRQDLPTSTPKYLYSEGLGRLGYCDRIQSEQPAVIVEGQLDAIRLIQEGIKNVIALGGAMIGGDIARLLAARKITDITYMPDNENDSNGKRKTDIINKAVEAFQTAEIDGKRVISTLYIADLPDQVGPNAKTDADSYGALHPGELRGILELGTVEAWAWQLDRLEEWATQVEEESGRRPIAQVMDRAINVYICNLNPCTRQRIRNYAGKCTVLAKYGITPQALADLDGWNARREYNERIKEAANNLRKAVEDEATPEQVGQIIGKLSAIQASDSRQEWAQQLNESFADELNEIRKQPETLATKWELGKITPNGFRSTSTIEFYPADIAVFCAPTSHGKTMILFEAALDLIRKNPNKTFLFVSCEENKRQLLERALNVYLPIETTENGKTSTGNYCFIRGTRKKTIKAIIKGAVPPKEYAQYMGYSEHYEALKNEVTRGLAEYSRAIRPRLKLIHTEASAESICSNIIQYVEEYRAQGVEVGGVFVDYMQLLTTDIKNFSRHDELKGICKALKDCAARTELPVIVAAQLNRETLKSNGKTAPIDDITVANIGEGADIERIAHDIYLVWQVDKTPLQPYTTSDTKGEAAGITPTTKISAGKVYAGRRSRRLFSRGGITRQDELILKRGYIYVEHLKARDGVTGGWGLFPFDGEKGTISENDTTKMAE